jgi:hypothetical protein
MNTSFGFIITRHVNSISTNNYWNQSVKLLRTFYPNTQIIIIDDNSNYEFVKSDYNYKNLKIIQSEFPKRGELLPYYYYLKYKFFKNAVIIHDSVFFHKKINFDKLNGKLNVLPLWHFNPDTENLPNTKKIIKNLKNNISIDSKLSLNENMLSLNHYKWYGCFGVQSYININFLEKIENKYNITNLISEINCRSDRCCLERILGCIFFTESNNIINQKSLFGDIMKYQKWGYSFNNYINNLKRGILPKHVVKVWTGR